MRAPKGSTANFDPDVKEAPLPVNGFLHVDFQTMFLARPEGGSCMIHTATTDNAAQNHCLEVYNTLRMPLTAWLMRMLFSIRAKRTKSSPYSPKPRPGDTATWASRIKNVENATDPILRYCSGILAQTNMVPLGLSISQPTRDRPDIRASRRD